MDEPIQSCALRTYHQHKSIAWIPNPYSCVIIGIGTNKKGVVMKIIKKRKGYSLQMRSVDSPNGKYLFYKTPNGSYHAFIEVAAKDAAKACGAMGKGNTRQLCKEICGF